jgi:hypothetical protein
VITLIAFGCPLPAIVAAFGLDERTVRAWQKRPGKHSQAVHEHLVEQPCDLLHVQAHEIRVKIQGLILWLAMALQVNTRLWLGAVVSMHRDEALILAAIQIVRRCALARPLLIAVDGLSSYLSAIHAVFRSPLPAHSRRRPLLISWPAIHFAQVIKHDQGHRVVGVVRQMAQGSLQTLLRQSGGGTKLNTAFIVRLNETFRAHLSSLTRRGRTLLHNEENLTHWSIGWVASTTLCRASQPAAQVIGVEAWIPVGAANASHGSGVDGSLLDCLRTVVVSGSSTGLGVSEASGQAFKVRKSLARTVGILTALYSGITPSFGMDVKSEYPC